MKIKRFFAKSMRQALRKVREEQGPDAVILSNRKVDDGIEVVAAVDYDASLMTRAVAQTQNALGAPPADTKTPTDPEEAAAVANASEAPAERPPGGRPSNQSAGFDAFLEAAEAVHAPRIVQPASIDLAKEPAVLAIHEELAGMRSLLQEQVSTLAWGAKATSDPYRAHMLRRLAKLGLDADVAEKVAQRALDESPAEQAGNRVFQVLASCLPVTRPDDSYDDGVVAVVGPTGVGKTTTIAKIAARFALRHGRDQLALVSTDSFRIGAQEQLATFAQILDVPVHLAHDRDDLARVLRSLRDKKLVLIDTAGVSQRDAALARNLSLFDVDGVHIKLLLALPANGQRQSLDEVARCFSLRRLHGAILTKLDEAASLGAAFSTVIRHTLPLAYLTDGQRVPEDLHAAGDKQKWLVNYAGGLEGPSGFRIEETTMARNYAQGPAHAHA